MTTKPATETEPDLTYDLIKINENPVWQLAFSLSEIQNDNAPIGWSRYIHVAECLLANYDIRQKPYKGPHEN